MSDTALHNWMCTLGLLLNRCPGTVWKLRRMPTQRRPYFRRAAALTVVFEVAAVRAGDHMQACPARPLTSPSCGPLRSARQRSDRRTLGIAVHPDLSIHVTAPWDTPVPIIEERLVAKGRWLLKQFRYFEEFLPRVPPREYVPGESHHYLGRRYVLKVKQANERSVKLKGGELQVALPDRHDREQVRQLLAG